MAVTDEQKKKVFFGAAIDHLPDPARSVKWRMIIPKEIFEEIGLEPTNGQSFAMDGGDDEFTLHIVGAPSLPVVKTDNKAIDYMGFQKYFATKQDGLAGEAEFTALFLEDMRAYEAMLAWNQACLNTGILSKSEMSESVHDKNRTATEGKNRVHLGLGQQANHNNPTALLVSNTTVRMELYDFMYGDVILAVNYINAWPDEVSVDGSFDYAQSNLMKWKFKLRYDRFNLWIPPGYHVL